MKSMNNEKLFHLADRLSNEIKETLGRFIFDNDIENDFEQMLVTDNAIAMFLAKTNMVSLPTEESIDHDWLTAIHEVANKFGEHLMRVDANNVIEFKGNRKNEI